MLISKTKLCIWMQCLVFEESYKNATHLWLHTTNRANILPKVQTHRPRRSIACQILTALRVKDRGGESDTAWRRRRRQPRSAVGKRRRGGGMRASLQIVPLVLWGCHFLCTVLSFMVNTMMCETRHACQRERAITHWYGS